MDIHQIRLKNLFLVIQKAGSQAKLADLIGVKSSYLSQIKNEKHPTNMGNDVARRIEEALLLPHGWMDKLETTKEMNIDVNKFKAMQKEEDEAEHELMTYFPMLLARQQKDILDRVKAYWEENRQLFSEFEKKRLKSE